MDDILLAMLNLKAVVSAAENLAIPGISSPNGRPSDFFTVRCKRHAICYLCAKHLTAERTSLVREVPATRIGPCRTRQAGEVRLMATVTKTAISNLTDSVKRQPASVALFLNEELASVPAAKVAREFRKMSRFVPVVVLLPKSAVIEKAGQDELETNKPGVALNVTPHASALLAATPGLAALSPADTFVFGEVTVSVSSMEIHRRGKRIALTCKQFKTLAYLIKNPRRVISRDELLNEVWGYQNYPCTRTVDNHIWQLRRKLEAEPARPRHFHTVHGAM
jgi:DNA-binding response OmpR family regulator